MKIIVAHTSPDWDAITSVWLLKRYFQGWEEAEVKFVPAGTKLETNKKPQTTENDPIEISDGDEIIHVDTGLGPLDHHQTSDMHTSAASLTFEYVKENSEKLKVKNDKEKVKEQALGRIVRYVVALDHFQEVFWPDPGSDIYEFGIFGVLEGYKVQYPNQDLRYVEFGMGLLDAMLHRIEERIWAEDELRQKGEVFDTRFGKGIAIQTISDDTMKLAQKMGYVIVVRKDPRKGYIRIKAVPNKASSFQNTQKSGTSDIQTIRSSDSPSFLSVPNIDLTLIKEKLSKMDPHATWFLHVSRKMLLNGTPKNPKMIPTTLSLQQIVDVVKNI